LKCDALSRSGGKKTRKTGTLFLAKNCSKHPYPADSKRKRDGPKRHSGKDRFPSKKKQTSKHVLYVRPGERTWWHLFYYIAKKKQEESKAQKKKLRGKNKETGIESYFTHRWPHHRRGKGQPTAPGPPGRNRRKKGEKGREAAAA